MQSKRKTQEEALLYLGSLCEREEDRRCHEESGAYAPKESLEKEVRALLLQLPLLHCQILLNDYLKPIDKNWWKGIYGSAYYEEQKNIAAETFFRCLNKQKMV